MTTSQTRPYPGYLFVLEGIDGAGKTTICTMIEKRLMEETYDVVRLREPTVESQWGQEIRRRSPSGELSPQEELDLFMKDREWNIKHNILPALSKGKIVLMDRYFFATGAYQSTSTGLSWAHILKLNRERISAPEPDIIFILDLPADMGLARVTGSRGMKNEQFEQLQRLIQVRQNYLDMSRNDSGNYVVIDASVSIEEVAAEVYDNICKYIGEA